MRLQSGCVHTTMYVHSSYDLISLDKLF